MTMLRAGPIGARLVYRWLRRQRRTYGDVYLRVDGLDGRLVEARGSYSARPRDPLVDLDLGCKTLDVGPLHWEGRTRCWYGSESDAWPRIPLRPGARGKRDHGDRAAGLWYARHLAAVLRAAHREGAGVTVRCVS